MDGSSGCGYCPFLLGNRHLFPEVSPVPLNLRGFLSGLAGESFVPDGRFILPFFPHTSLFFAEGQMFSPVIPNDGFFALEPV